MKLFFLEFYYSIQTKDMRIIILISISFIFASSAVAQVMEFDKLEMKYDQGHYRMVYRKANRLLDNPYYDYSYLPSYYRALSMVQLSQNRTWFRRNSYAISEAKEILLEMNKTIEGRTILKAHAYELSSLRKDLKQWKTDLKLTDDKLMVRMVDNLLETVFSDLPYVIDMQEDQKPIDITPPESVDENTISEVRSNLINHSRKYLGVPYQWGGASPQGFDCSGFTTYLMKEDANLKLDRRAVEQYKAAKKVRKKNVQPGDFAFFDNGSGISHVGMVISTENNSVQMIHASTSLGISIVDIYQSSYWSKRIVGFGTFL